MNILIFLVYIVFVYLTFRELIDMLEERLHRFWTYQIAFGYMFFMVWVARLAFGPRFWEMN